MPCTNQRAGFTLIEAIIALTVLAVSGTAMAGLVTQTLSTSSRAASLERQTADLDRLLSAYTLLTIGELERRPGTEVVGPYRVTVMREPLGVFVITATGAEAATLSTAVYRGPQ